MISRFWLVCWLLWCLLVGSAHAQDAVAYDMRFTTVARGSVKFDLPNMIGGPDGDVLLATVDASGLRCGTITQVLDTTYTYTTIYERVDPVGCTDVATYTLSDGKGFRTSATITIEIAANQAPYAGDFISAINGGQGISVNHELVIDVTPISWDSDGDVVRLVRVGTPRYGTATSDGNIITYRPIKAKVSPETGAKDAFSYSITDGRGLSGQAIIEVTISENRPPYINLPIHDFRVHHNQSVIIDLQVSQVNETTWPIYDTDGDSVTGTVDFSTAKLGRVRQLGDGLYEYSAFPGVSDSGNDVRETFPLTVSDDRGGSTTGEITVVILANTAPYIEGNRIQAVVTISSKPVVVAPLVWVRDYDDGDEAALVALNISSPKHGTLEFISCCNSNKDATYYYKEKKQVADYRYTPRPDITSEVVENLTYIAADLKGGFVTALISITIKPGPKCNYEMFGIMVPGFLVEQDTYGNGIIPECGGVFSWVNCFSGDRTERHNAACNIGGYFRTEDVYGPDSPYNGSATYVCVLPSRKLPCRTKSDPAARGLTMWQSLATEPCSAECELVTQGFKVPASAYVATPADCDVCIDCEPDRCPYFSATGGRVLGPEICCVGAPGVGNDNSTNNNNGTQPLCSICKGQPAAAVCGSDGNTYASPCMAACQGVNVSTEAPCEGTPAMLDLSQVPDLTSTDAKQLMREGFQVLGIAQTTDAPTDDDGFPVPDAAGAVSAAALSWRAPKHHHFQVLLISRASLPSNQTLLAGLKGTALSKIFNSYKNIAKASQVVLKDVPGPRVDFKIDNLKKMVYPYQAIGLVAKVTNGNTDQPRGFCTGWMIRTNLVVTSAHCVYNTTLGLATWPGYLRFLPQVWGGKAPSDKLKGLQGYEVKAIAIPGWYEALRRNNNDGPRTRQDTYLWDMALLYLAEPVDCNQCLLRPAIVVGPTRYSDRLQMAGYGTPANVNLQLNMSLPFDGILRPNMAYTFTKAASTKGHSGAPYWPAAIPYESDRDMTGAPNNVLPFSWPALGVHQGNTGKSKTGNNAVMMQFTAAHLKWLYWAGGRNKAVYLACTGDLARDNNCVAYKYAGQ